MYLRLLGAARSLLSPQSVTFHLLFPGGMLVSAASGRLGLGNVACVVCLCGPPVCVGDSGFLQNQK